MMGVKHLSRNAQKVDEDTWYYEEPECISVYSSLNWSVDSHITNIPWRKLRASLKRRDRKEAT